MHIHSSVISSHLTAYHELLHKFKQVLMRKHLMYPVVKALGSEESVSMHHKPYQMCDPFTKIS